MTDAAAPVTPRPEGRSNGETAMDAVVKPWAKPSPAEKPTLSDHVRAAPEPVVPKPSREEALAAVRTLIAYAGDDPDREGLPSARWVVTTISCWCATSPSIRIA